MRGICQIQIQPVDNGFVVQAVNIDGERYSRKMVAPDEAGLRKLIHEVADELFVPRPQQEKGKSEPEPAPA